MEVNLQDPLVGEKRLFANNKIGKISAVYVNQILREAKEEAGLYGKLTYHTLRHYVRSGCINDLDDRGSLYTTA